MSSTTDNKPTNNTAFDEEDHFLRPEHDPSSFVNHLAKASPIIGAPSFTLYDVEDYFVIVIRKRTS